MQYFAGGNKTPSNQEGKLHFLGLSGTQSLLFSQPFQISTSYVRHKKPYQQSFLLFYPNIGVFTLIFFQLSYFRVSLLFQYHFIHLYHLSPPNSDIVIFSICPSTSLALTLSLCSPPFLQWEHIIPGNGLSVAYVDNQPAGWATENWP